MIISDLADGYPGDAAWTAFALAYGSDGHDVVSAALAILEHRGTAWLDRSIPALQGLSPNEVLADGPSGALIIRALLMRMP